MDEPQKISTSIDLETLVEKHADYLFRYAMLQLKDETLAEDAVQETLLSAIEKWESFAKQSQLRTWMTGILKHKIIDIFRRNAKENTLYIQEAQSQENQEHDAHLFDQTGHWIKGPESWGNPERALENKNFWRFFTECLQALTPKASQAFTLREISGLSNEEICKTLDITPNNGWVMLHRARTSLRQCLSERGFNTSQG